ESKPNIMEIDPNHLPKDPDALQRMVIGLVEQLATQQRELRQVQHLLEQLLRWRYGQKRERIDENQLFLFATSVICHVVAPTPGSTPLARQTSTAGKKGHGRRPLPAALQRRRVVYDLGEHERQCPHCQNELRPIGEEVSERLEYVPASCYVIEEACRKYACPHGCTVVTANKPAAPIEKGRAGAGLLAHIAVSKFGDHLPLHRQEGILERQGVHLSRKTMCDWMRQCAELVSPLFERMKQRV